MATSVSEDFLDASRVGVIKTRGVFADAAGPGFLHGNGGTRRRGTRYEPSRTLVTLPLKRLGYCWSGLVEDAAGGGSFGGPLFGGAFFGGAVVVGTFVRRRVGAAAVVVSGGEG